MQRKGAADIHAIGISYHSSGRLASAAKSLACQRFELCRESRRSRQGALHLCIFIKPKVDIAMEKKEDTIIGHMPEASWHGLGDTIMRIRSPRSSSFGMPVHPSIRSVASVKHLVKWPFETV
jgi:hypothetical protein